MSILLLRVAFKQLLVEVVDAAMMDGRISSTSEWPVE
jgi:hypothetical protein